MADIVFDCFPNGRRKALHMSYDDGMVQDRRLVDIFHRYGIRATFHLNSGRLDLPGYLGSDEIAALFAGHEVGVHSVSHPCLPHLPRERVISEVMEDRRALEQIVGYVVRGMSYPGGDVSDAIVSMLPMLGIAYARTTAVVKTFSVPENPYRWPMNCHHSQALEVAESFLRIPPQWGMQLLYVMGHSYEFDRDGNWSLIQQFCAQIGGRDEIWYATNIEIADYLNSLRMVRVSVDGTLLTNPSASSVWCSLWEGGVPIRALELPPGETIRIE